MIFFLNFCFNCFLLDNGPTSLIYTLRGHTRTITDLNWSHNDPNALATASYDNYIHIWDLRDGSMYELFYL